MASFLSYGTHQYTLLGPYDWQTAQQTASRSGGHLAIITSAAEDALVLQYALLALQNSGVTLSGVADGGGATYIWLGASDIGTEGSWLWDDATQVSGYTNWGSGIAGTEPDNYEDQDALALGLEAWPLGGGIGVQGEWNDIDAGNSLYAMFEFEQTIATAGSDTFLGTTSNDDAYGGGGNDEFALGTGIDAVELNGAPTDYQFQLNADGTVSIAGPDGNDTASGIEIVRFLAATGETLQSIVSLMPTVQIDCERHYAKVQAYFRGILGRDATVAEADQFTALLQSNQSRIWWYDSAQTTMTGSLMNYLQEQAEYAALTTNDNATIVNTVFNRLTGLTAPQEMTDHYAARLDAGTLRVQGIANKLLGELYLSPKGDGTLGTIEGFADNRAYMNSEAYRGYLDILDAIDGVSITNLDASGNLVVVGVTA
jgi:hypothetical protein